MSHKSDQSRLEFVLEMIFDIEKIFQRHGSFEKAMEDIEGKHALLMCCLQIGETMGRIEGEELRKALPVALASALRNVIAHDYLGVSPERIIATLETSIPALKTKVENLLA